MIEIPGFVWVLGSVAIAAVIFVAWREINYIRASRHICWEDDIFFAFFAAVLVIMLIIFLLFFALVVAQS